MEVDVSSQIAAFNEFFTTIYKSRIDDLLRIYPTQRSVFVTYTDLEKFDPDLADALVRSPDPIVDAAEEAIKQLNLRVPAGKDFTPHVRFVDVPSEDKLIEQLSSKNINELVAFKCVVTKRAEVMHRVKVAMYKCQLCDAEMKLFIGKNFTPPKRCESCKKYALRQVDEESTFTDIQKAEVQELLERIRGGAPAAHIELVLEDDLVNKLAPGDNVDVVGVLRLRPPIKMRQKQELIYSRFVEANSVRSLKKDFEEIEITKEEERRLKELAKNPEIGDVILRSIAPSIYGHNEVKKALALQLFGGTRGKTMTGGMPIRDDIHILLIGDPGIAKSRFLQSVSEIAPKSIYVSGKSVSGAGLTVTAEKDELGEGGWTLKAGALVLASGGTAQVDEFDKIEEEDLGALHEAMETQSYHYSTKLMLSDGREMPIGELVETRMDKNRDRIIKGHDCLVLRDGIADMRILTTDFNGIFETTPAQISKHTAPDHFIKVVLQTGREFLVTPEHPFWVVEDGEIKTKEARELTERDYTLMPRKLPLTEKPLGEEEREGIFKLVGYHITDGGYELNRGVKNGINFYNKDATLIEDYEDAVETAFGANIYSRTNPKTGVIASRIISKPVLETMRRLHPSLAEKGADKIIPPQMLSAPKPQTAALLRAVFDSDGTFSDHYVGLVGENRQFIEQVQILLLRFGIRSHIFMDGKVFRLTITGKENLETYKNGIGFLSRHKMAKLDGYLARNGAYRNTTDVIAGCDGPVFRLLEGLGIPECSVFGYGLHIQKRGYCFTRRNFTTICEALREKVELVKSDLMECGDSGGTRLREIRHAHRISQEEIARAAGVSRATVTYWEKTSHGDRYRPALRAVLERRAGHEKELCKLERIAYGDIGFVGISRVDQIPNTGEKWVYDVTVEPSRAFISECAVLHNTISVAKAGIVAKFRTKTAILAAANPKYGRFDQTKNLADQFDVQPALLSRFDLIFPIADVLDEEKDAKLADHILSTHMGKEIVDADVFDKDLLRKYIAYARRNIFPKLTKEASEEIKRYYVELRGKSKDSGSVAITPRYLEGLVRLAEANAKMRLKETVEEEDAEMAISLFNYVMMQILTDKVTGKFDVDVVATGKPKSTRDKMQREDTILDIIREHLRRTDTAEVKEVVSNAKSYDIDEGTAHKIITELLRRGVIYEKEYGHIKIVGE